MHDSLVELENRRAAVQAQIAQLGDMRTGSITLQEPGAVVEIRTVIAIRMATQATVPAFG